MTIKRFTIKSQDGDEGHVEACSASCAKILVADLLPDHRLTGDWEREEDPRDDCWACDGEGPRRKLAALEAEAGLDADGWEDLATGLDS